MILGSNHAATGARAVGSSVGKVAAMKEVMLPRTFQ